MATKVNKLDIRDTSYKHCTHCLVMHPERNFRRGSTETCKECESSPGFVYIAHNPAWGKVYKVGITNDPVRRLHDYNSCIPFNDTEFIFVKGTGFYREIETEMLAKFSYNRVINPSGQRSEWLTNINETQELIDSINYFHYEQKALKELEID